MALKALGIGLIAGLLAVCFRLSLESAEAFRKALFIYSAKHSLLFHVVPPLLFGLLIMAVVYCTLKYSPDSGGSGIPHLKGYLGGFNTFRAWRILLVKYTAGVVGIGSGLALGREGPTVQMGAAIAKIAGDYVSPNVVERRVLISAGAGAGLAAAFNAPMAGLFFVLEELHSSFHQAVLITAFVATVTADIVCRLIIGRLPVFHIQITSYPELGMFPYFIALGVLIGLLGLLFNVSLLKATDYVGSMEFGNKMKLAFFLGICFGLTGFLFPESIGTGTDLISNALSSKVVFQQLFFFFILRFTFTMISYATGAPGGIFAPLLLLGVLAGSLFGDFVSTFSRGAVFDFSVWGVLGMAGYFSAVVRAPITGTILILEMTGAYDLLLPLMIVSIISYSIPEFFKDKPIYESLLERDLHRKKQEAAQTTLPA